MGAWALESVFPQPIANISLPLAVNRAAASAAFAFARFKAEVGGATTGQAAKAASRRDEATAATAAGETAVGAAAAAGPAAAGAASAEAAAAGAAVESTEAAEAAATRRCLTNGRAGAAFPSSAT